MFTLSGCVAKWRKGEGTRREIESYSQILPSRIKVVRALAVTDGFPPSAYSELTASSRLLKFKSRRKIRRGEGANRFVCSFTLREIEAISRSHSHSTVISRGSMGNAYAIFMIFQQARPTLAGKLSDYIVCFIKDRIDNETTIFESCRSKCKAELLLTRLSGTRRRASGWFYSADKVTK